MADSNLSGKKDSWLRLRFYNLLLVFGWTATVALSLGFNLYQYYLGKLEVARAIARSNSEKDMLLRQWNTSHGFVFAPVTEKNPPNPHLTLPERDITPPSGKSLTALNSSYMLRQVHQLAEATLDIKGHMTSLRPLRPENGPDPWEAQAIQALTQGSGEVSAPQEMGGKAYMRLMRPIFSEKGCLRCHAEKGYHAGESWAGSVSRCPWGRSGRRGVRNGGLSGWGTGFSGSWRWWE